MRIIEHSHQDGRDVVTDPIYNKMLQTLADVSFCLHRNCSTELTTKFLHALTEDGWSDRVLIYQQRNTGLTITSMNGQLGLCLQVANMARCYADLLKLQALYYDGRIKGAFYIIPTRSSARIMGSNIANYERFTSELTKVFKKVISVPIIILGFENKEGECV